MRHVLTRRQGLLLACLFALAPAAVACGGSEAAGPDVVALTARRIDVGGAPWGVAVDGDAVWVSDASRATLLELDAATGLLRREVATGATDPRDAGIVVEDGQVWVTNLGGSVGILDAATGIPLRRVPVSPGEPAAVALTAGAGWIPRHGPDGGLTRISETSGEEGSIDLPRSGFAVATTADTVWVSGLEADLFAIDVVSDTVRLEVDLPGAPRGVAVADGDVWLTLRDRGQVVRVDGASGEVVSRIDLEGRPWPIATGAGAVWVADLEGRLLRIDPSTEQVTGTAPIAVQPRAIAVSENAVWVSGQGGTVTRVDLDG